VGLELQVLLESKEQLDQQELRDYKVLQDSARQVLLESKEQLDRLALLEPREQELQVLLDQREFKDQLAALAFKEIKGQQALLAVKAQLEQLVCKEQQDHPEAQQEQGLMLFSF
jgi:hypothetical protein